MTDITVEPQLYPVEVTIEPVTVEVNVEPVTVLVAPEQVAMSVAPEQVTMLVAPDPVEIEVNLAGTQGPPGPVVPTLLEVNQRYTQPANTQAVFGEGIVMHAGAEIVLQTNAAMVGF